LEKTLLEADNVIWVQTQLADGAGIGIYPRHAPLLAETVPAPLHYADESGEHTLDLEGGILQIEGDRVTIFTSGLAGDEIIEEEPDDGHARFDRLAYTLLTTLGAKPGGVFGIDDEAG
jgi:F0F1-type ATP synthase epsilon subunit